MNVGGVGGLELLVILVVALLVLGPTRLASTARTLGRLSRELRKGTAGITNMLEELAGGTATDDEDDPEEAEDSPPPEAQPRPQKRRAPANTPPSPTEDSGPGV